MNRARSVLVLGVFVAVVGAFVLLRAGSLATHWQPLAPNSWGGMTDPADVRSYQWIGLSLLVFGLLVTAAALVRWMGAGDFGRSDRVVT
jgi:hypothetical protein